MLREMDRLAKQDFDFQDRHNHSDQLPVPDPWKLLLKADVSPQVKQVCRAAQSQLPALRHLCGMACHRASRKTEWDRELIKAKEEGNSLAFDRAFSKVFDGLLRAGFARWYEPQLSEANRRLLKERRAHFVKRGLRTDAEGSPLEPSLNQIRQFKIEYFLVELWVCFHGYDLPGLMFWSTTAITQLLLARLGRLSQTHGKREHDSTKSARQELGLLPVSAKSPWVWNAKIRRLSGGEIEITLLSRDGHRLSQGKLRWMD
jgi:hypothetical protein